MKIAAETGRPAHRRFSNSEDELELVNEAKEDAYRFIIVVSGLFSLCSIICLCLIVPSLYSYVDTMGQFGRQDFAYCEVCQGTGGLSPVITLFSCQYCFRDEF